MVQNVATCPIWLEKHINRNNGAISFRKFMDLSLNDPENGAYATGRLQIGKKGDFTTSPSMNSEFADLLAIQIIDWINQISSYLEINEKIFLIDIGPGEGTLSRDLIFAIEKISKPVLNYLEIIFIETNKGMIEKQKKTFEKIKNISYSWKTYKEIKSSSISGIVLAHEILDALPVERITFVKDRFYRVGVEIKEQEDKKVISLCNLPLHKPLENSITNITQKYKFKLPPLSSEDGWTTEWNLDLKDWFEEISRILKFGTVLIVDYALDQKRYFTSARSDGTIISYKNNSGYLNILSEAGKRDLTAHLCLELIKYYSEENGFTYLGDVSQGMALLSLGLAKRISLLSEYSKQDLSLALEKRETLLRLVDPITLGSFKWIALQYSKNNELLNCNENIKTKFLLDPAPT